MIDRPLAAARVHELFRSHPCVAIHGPRQRGKTTLARAISAGETAVSFFDLGSSVDARRLEAPLRTLGALDLDDPAISLRQLPPSVSLRLHQDTRPAGHRRAADFQYAEQNGPPFIRRGREWNFADGLTKTPDLPSVAMRNFCVPENDKLLGYWTAVADCLFKIRLCMNIEGQVRQLPLFEPPRAVLDRPSATKRNSKEFQLAWFIARDDLFGHAILLIQPTQTVDIFHHYGNAVISHLFLDLLRVETQYPPTFGF